ncbi:RHS repeat-associated core domain-containing protein [Pseudomonas japonica]|uniref:RHS repeat-associated core domain-containing protein n=1 Tax=Pseudomonas japonica TaxID=256466 RepID=UPI0015E46ADE|nr:RHS repeat-associated core domain-containing protein [Pseudomonas japonica]MBA1287568.1 hypothetical protein [Pseudomonas japonica]
MRELIVLSCAHSQTVLSEGQSRRRYLPFGWCGPSAISTSLNGHWKERSGQIYLFGNGYRPYFPTLGRFGSPDKLSPFGRGGVNAYGYAAQDPANYHDTNGRFPQLFNTLGKWKSSFLGFVGDAFGIGETNSVMLITDALYTFDDFTKQGKRLNIVSHGNIIDDRSYTEITKDMAGSPEQMMRLISNHIPDFSSYRTARTLICYSGDIPKIGKPIGKVVAERTGLVTKSYKGPISVHWISYDIKSPTRSRQLIRANIDGSFDFKSSHTVAKFPNPVNSYKPVYFDP